MLMGMRHIKIALFGILSFCAAAAFAGDVTIRQVTEGRGSSFAVADAQARRYKSNGNVVSTFSRIENGEYVVKIVVEQKISQQK